MTRKSKFSFKYDWYDKLVETSYKRWKLDTVINLGSKIHIELIHNSKNDYDVWYYNFIYNYIGHHTDFRSKSDALEYINELLKS